MNTSVTYSATALPTCTGTTSLITNQPIFGVGCSNARTDNLVAFKFVFENVGNRIIASFQPYAVFVTAAGPNGTTQTQIGLSSQGISNLLSDDGVRCPPKRFIPTKTSSVSVSARG